MDKGKLHNRALEACCRCGKKLRQKVFGQKGESLAETLGATLVAVMGITLLAGAIMSSGRLIVKSRNMANSYYQTNNVLSDEPTKKSVSGAYPVMTIKDGRVPANTTHQDLTAGQAASNRTVEYFVNDKGDVASYRLHINNTSPQAAAP